MLNGHPIQILLVEDDLAHAGIVRRSLADFRVADVAFSFEDDRPNE